MSVKFQRPDFMTPGLSPVAQIGRMQRYLSRLADELNIAFDMVETAVTKAEGTAAGVLKKMPTVYSPKEAFHASEDLLRLFAACLVQGFELVATEEEPVKLDDLKTPGNYYSANAENSQYITDSPYTEGGFCLQVRQMQTENHLRQELSYGVNTLLRHWDGESWSNWVRIQTTEDLG